ncbi:helix-turn-helix domain-containing protein [Streptomyces sp. 891-h]|uniref:helix-turn-helix domain-containing protein n=1 Tax=Streptomyces sp. 891-h TaxID=2720714 RepID=UPI001FAAD1A9|nr:helix-turn-helix domain-containing protein [Streptomyces sp. 891-h]UNZ18157.1 helix-turn-helix transcriptional regulator [Streptomyces sp. 891-h]
MISRVLRNARARREPRGISSFEALLGPRTERGLSQEDVALLCGVSERWYRRLESGEPRNYSDAFLTAVRRVLDLSEGEWDLVSSLSRNQAASQKHQPSAHAQQPKVPAPLRTLLDGLPWSAYICDHRWDVLACNTRLTTDFSWLVHENFMVWCLTHHDARSRLIDWEEGWAKPIVAQLLVHAEKWKDDPRMRAVVRTALADPDVRRLWNAPDDLPIVFDPDMNEPRRLHLPRQGAEELRVALLALTPSGHPHWRLMALVPT